jgi:hypothetical protein
VKASLTRAAIILIAINAALAVVILALGRMGETEGRILGTSMLATTTALLAMIQLPAVRDRRIGTLPIVGIGASGIGFVIVTAGIWTDGFSEFWGRVAGSAYTVAVAGAVAVILTSWPIRGKAKWVGTAAPILTVIAAVMILGGIWFELDSEAYWRSFGVVAVLLAAAGLAVPVLHRGSILEEGPSSIGYCPFCGTGLNEATGIAITCKACSQRFSVSASN